MTNEFLPKLKILAAPCGAGKTTVLLEEFQELSIKGKFSLYAGITNDLVDQFHDELAPLIDPNIPIWKFSSKITKTVRNDIIALLDSLELNPVPCIILCTHAAYQAVREEREFKNFHVHIDEMMNVWSRIDAKMVENHHVLTNHLEAILYSDEYLKEHPNMAKYARVYPKDYVSEIELKRIANHPVTPSEKEAQAAARAIVSKHQEVFVVVDILNEILAYTPKGSPMVIQAGSRKTDKNIPKVKSPMIAINEKLISKNILETNRYPSSIVFFSILSPEIYQGSESTTLVSASFEKSVMKKLWKDKVVFSKNVRLANKLKFQEHQNGYLAKIIYGTTVNWSKYNKNKSIDSYTTSLDLIQNQYNDIKVKNETVGNLFARRFAELIGDDSYFQVLNTEDLDKKTFLTGDSISTVSHGMNSFQNISNVFYLAAINPDTTTQYFLQAIGISSLELRDSLAHDIAYQCIMRSSLRDNSNIDTKLIFVPDKLTALSLMDKLPGSTVEQDVFLSQLEFKEAKKTGRPSKFESRAKTFEANSRKSNSKTLYKRDRKEEIELSTIPSKYEKIPRVHKFASWNDVFDLLISRKDNIVLDKEINDMISSSVMHNGKKKENVERQCGIFLDIDNSELTKNEILALFDCKVLIWDSFTPGNVRILIPTTHSMNLNTSKLVKRLILTKTKLKVDTTKINESSFFWMPCNGAEFVTNDSPILDPLLAYNEMPTEWFSKEFNLDDYDMFKYSKELFEMSENVVQITKNIKKKRSVNAPFKYNGTVEAAIESYKSVPSGIKKRYTALWILARKLKSKNLKEMNIADILYEVSGGDHNRQKQVKDIINNFKNL